MMLSISLLLVELVIILFLLVHLRRLDRGKGEAETEVIRLRKNLEGLLTISEATKRSDPLANVYQHTLDVVLEIVGFSDASIFLLDEEGALMYNIAHRNWTPAMEEEMKALSQEYFTTNVQEVIATREPVFTSDMTHNPARYPPTSLAAGYRANVITPLLALDRVIGIMVIDSKQIHTWTEEEVRWLATIGRYLGIIIDHIRISDQVRDMAILQERERLSQELHDNLAQLINALRVWAEAALLSMEEKEWDRVSSGLEKIKNIAQEAYTNLRDEMLGLREHLDQDRHLVPALSRCLSRFQQQWEIEAVLEPGNVMEEMVFPPQLGIQLLRIIQEALSNTHRHAKASRVVVRLQKSNHDLQVQIEDDGYGFDPDQVTGERLGLRIMRERAMSLGGKLTICARPGAGTRLLIELPLYPQVEQQK